MQSGSWFKNLNVGWVFKAYLKIFGSLGAMFGKHESPDSQQHPEPMAELKDAAAVSLESVDREAFIKGNHHRALGISIGVLGIVIVFLALAPIGFNLSAHADHMVGYVKIALMLVMLLIVFLGKRTSTHKEWVRLRALAEQLRYQPLSRLIEQANETDEVISSLESELERILDGKNGQIAYHVAKAHQYHAVEHFSDVLLWLSVVLALIGAVGHLFFDWSWWIFLTAFGPAAVGGIHGINGFLGINTLAEEHETTGQLLAKDLSDLRVLQTQPARAEGVLALAKNVLGIVTSRDIRWKESAEKLGLRPA